MKVTFKHSSPVTDSIRTFYFQPDKPVRFIAGQFIELHIPHERKDNRGDKRWFTLSSAPHDQLLTITTNFSAENSSTFKKALLLLEPETVLTMASPMGDFVLPKDSSIPLVFVAGGIGCTPFHSIISELQQTGGNRDITFLYSVRKLEHVAFHENFDKLGDNFKVIVAEPETGYSGETGRLTAEKILQLAPVTGQTYVYISGPEPMVEVLTEDLKKCGINKKHVNTDYFPGYQPI